ncbi:MAG TPA: exopolysaccharide biosynthesis protein [Rhizobiaceae bacterium]|nr:exopolysaccharide biosynthesis protein [Rhizobiaceae bacterium]
MHGFDDGQIDAAPIRRRPRRLSQLFAQLARDADGPISLAKIRDAMGDRGFAALLFFFAAINMIPLPPGASAFLGLPLLIVSLQMVYGSKRAWLPSFLRDRSISADTFRSISGRVVPWLIWVEQMIRPRYWPFWRRRGDRVIGVIALILAIIVTLPIPLGNWLPAFSTALLGLSLIERDGILLAIGSAVGVFALAVVAFIGGAFFLAVEAAYGWLF